MSRTQRAGIAVFTSDITKYRSLPRAHFNEQSTVGSADSSIAFKEHVLRFVNTIAIDFTTSTGFSALSVFFGAVRIALTDSNVTICGIGAPEPPLGQFTTDIDERRAIEEAINDSRILFFGSSQEFVDWVITHESITHEPSLFRADCDET